MHQQDTHELSLCAQGMADLIGATLATGNGFKFRVTGFSMAPFIKDNDVVVLVPADPQSVETGDVVACMDRNNGRLIVHRVVKKKGPFYILKGDNTFTMDPPMDRESILGRVAGLERNGRSMTLSLGTGKRAIAFFSRIGWLQHLLAAARSILTVRNRLFFH